MGKPKIAIIHQQAYGLERVGGAEMVCLWALEALKDEYDVTLIVPFTGDFMQRIDLLNNQYGTTFKAGDFSVRTFPWSRFLQRILTKVWAFRTYYFMARVRSVASEYDLMFSTFNEMDFGKKGLQYIHYPMIASVPSKGVNGKIKFFYRKLMPILFGYNKERMLKNVSVTCSKWTSRDIRTIYPELVGVQVVYPPVLKLDLSNTQKKQYSFAFVGRVSPEKRVEEVIAICEGLRAIGYAAELHIIGPMYRKEYGAYIKSLLVGKEWIHMHGQADRRRLGELLSVCSYGINCTRDEQFGIALVEMIYAKCLPFVFNGGGQREVVHDRKELMFSSQEEAVAAIDAVINNEPLKNELLSDLLKHSELFSVKQYMDSIRNLVRTTLSS